MLVFSGGWPAYQWVVTALILALWTVALCLVRVGTVKLSNRGVYTAGVVDAPFRPVRPQPYVRRSAARKERSSKFLLASAALTLWAGSLPSQGRAVMYLTGFTHGAMTSVEVVAIMLAAMILDAVAVGFGYGLVAAVWRRRQRRRRPWFMRAAWAGRRPLPRRAGGGARVSRDRSGCWFRFWL